MFSSLFHAALYQPIFNLFVALYNVLPGHDLGLVILTITILVRVILYPLTSSSIKAQKSMQEMQPKIAALKKQYANDKQKQAQATMELYKNHKINPLTSCLPMLVQLPLLIALFLVLRDGLASSNISQNLYPFVHNPGTIKSVTLGLLDLAKPNIVLAVLAGAAQFLQAKTLSRKTPPKEAGAGGADENMAAIMNKQMLYFMPIMTIIIGIRFPAGLTLYWFLSTILMVAQQMWLSRNTPSTPSGSNIIEGQVVK